MHYEVIQRHRSEYPAPITFAKGAPLFVGERYEGAGGWEDWYFCSTPGQREGWVPAQVFNMTAPGAATRPEPLAGSGADFLQAIQRHPAGLAAGAHAPQPATLNSLERLVFPRSNARHAPSPNLRKRPESPPTPSGALSAPSASKASPNNSAAEGGPPPTDSHQAETDVPRGR